MPTNAMLGPNRIFSTQPAPDQEMPPPHTSNNYQARGARQSYLLPPFQQSPQTSLGYSRGLDPGRQHNLPDSTYQFSPALGSLPLYPVRQQQEMHDPRSSAHASCTDLQPGGVVRLHHSQGQLRHFSESFHPQYYTQYYTQYYMDRAHLGQQQRDHRSFRCERCLRSFNRNHDLNRHKRIHLAVKPFPCGHCNKEFTRKDALKVSFVQPENRRKKRS